MRGFTLSLLCLAALTLGTACGNPSSGNGSGDPAPEKMVEQGYALTYDFRGDTYIYANKGKYFRQDSGEGPAHNAYIFVRGMGDERRDDIYHEDEGVWFTEKYRAEQTINGFFSSFIADNHEIYEQNGYVKTGTATICGKVCEGMLAIYGDLGRKNKKGEFAVWNGFTLRVKSGEEVIYECKNIKIGIPDSAFDKSLDTSWAK